MVDVHGNIVFVEVSAVYNDADGKHSWTITGDFPLGITVGYFHLADISLSFVGMNLKCKIT